MAYLKYYVSTVQVAQLAENLTCMHEVEGSSPALGKHFWSPRNKDEF